MATVLIVDDDRAVRRAIATTVGALGHQAGEAGDGESALAWLSRHRADAVLLDLRMPGMDGMDVLRRIKAGPDAPPVTVLTAVPTSDNTIEAMRLGAADHLAKSIGRDALQALLARMQPSVEAALPPLRERLADIIPLAEHFRALSADNAPPKRLSADAAVRLLEHPWPGNVRELPNAMKRATTLVRRPVIAAADLPFLQVPAGSVGAADWLAGTLPEAVARLVKALIRRALASSGGNRAQAAELLGIRRQLLYHKHTVRRCPRIGRTLSPQGTCTRSRALHPASNINDFILA